MKHYSFWQTVGMMAVSGALCAPDALGVYSVTIQKGSFQTGSGGEFVAITSPSLNDAYSPSVLQTISGQTGFSTFCLERSEKIVFGVAYTGELNDRAISGGADVTEVPNLPGDPLSLGAAWLYTLFSDGVLPGYDYGTAPYSSGEKTARRADAGVLQNAIWMLEDEYPLDLGNTYIDLAVLEFGSIEAAKAANEGAYPVQVMNLNQSSTKRQDFLVRVASQVPDGGATAVLLGMGLIGLAPLQRRLGHLKA